MFIPLEELPELIGKQPVIMAALTALGVNLVRLETPMSVIGKVWTALVALGYGLMAYELVCFPTERLAWMLTWGGVTPAEQTPALSGWYVVLGVSLVLATLATALADLLRGGLIAFASELITVGLAVVVVSTAFALFASYDEHWAFAGRTFGWTLATVAFVAYVAIAARQWRLRLRRPARYSVREVKFPI